MKRLPTKFIEDSANKCFYTLMERGQGSLADLILDMRRKQVYVPFEQIQKILHSACISLSKLYEAGLQHMHIKPSNIISMGDDHYVLSDLGEFSVAHEDTEYAAPEQTVVQQQNRFSKQKTEPTEIDIFRLGLSMVEVATLRGIQELKVFRNPKLANSNIAVNYRREVQVRYGEKFSLLLNDLLQVDSDRRVSLKDLLTKHLDDFMKVDQPHSIEINAQERAVNMVLDDALKRIRDRGQKPNIYFDQYEMDQITQVIHTQAFFDALKNLGINLSNGEKQLVKSTLSHEGSLSELKLTQFLMVGSSGVLRMRELGTLQEKSLRELMKEVQSFSNQNKVELQQQFMRKDPKSLNYLDTVTFADIMAYNKMELSSEDLRLVGDKYDPMDKGRIYYKFFIEDMQSSTIAAETDLKVLIFEMYQIIRNKFNTIDAFLNKLDPQSKGSIGIKDIASFLNQYNIQPSMQVLEQLFKIIDPQGQQVAAYLRIRNLFILPIDKEITAFLQSTANILLSTSSTLGQTLERQSENSQIDVEKLFELFQSMGLKLKRPDLTFYLVTLRIQRPQDNIVNINEIREEFYKQAKRLGVLNLYVFKGPTDDQEHKQVEPNGVYQRFLEKLKYKLNFLNNQEIFSLFEVSLKKDTFVDFHGFCQKIDEIDGSVEVIEKRNVYARLDPNNENRVSMKNFLDMYQLIFYNPLFRLGIQIDAQQVQLTQMEDKIQGFEPGTFNSMKEIISAINSGVEKLGVTVGQYFTPKKSKLDQTDYRYLLKQIDIYVSDYSDYEKFALAISYTSDQNQIDIDKLLRILTYDAKRQKLEQLTKVSQQHISPARTVVLWFEQVVQRMILNKLDFYIFQDFDIFQYGFITRMNFEQALSKELSIETDQSFELFVNYLKDDRSGDISLRKLKEGIEKERDSRLVYEDLVDLVKEQRMDIDRIFRNYDFNSSQSMDIREFERLIHTLQPTISSAVIEVLFIKFDDNNDQSISLKEFRTRIIGQQQGIGPTAQKNLIIQQFIEDLEILLHDKGTTFEDVFKPYEHQGTIKIDDFKDAIRILGFPMKEEKTKLRIIIESLLLYNKQQRLNMKLLREQFHRFKKTSDNGEFMLGEDDVKRVENFANLIERKLQRVNKSYQEVFVQRAKTYDGNFSFEDVKNIVIFNLQMEDSVDQKMFFRYIQNTGGQNLVSIEQLEKLILSKRGISKELTNKVIEFLNKNPQIMNEFESIDQSQQGFISPIELRRAFRKLGGPTLEPEEIRILGDKYQAIRNGQIDYKKLLSQAKLSIDNGLSLVDKLQSELRESLSQRKVNLSQMMEVYDRGNGKVKVVALLQELKAINVTLTTAQEELLFAVIIPDKTNSVDLQELVQFVERGCRRGESLGERGGGYQNSKLTKFQDRQSPPQIIARVQDSIKHYLEEKSISARALFRKLEKSDPEFLSFAEFKKALQHTFGVVATEQEYEAVFESFDVSKSYRLSMEEFEFAVLGEEAYGGDTLSRKPNSITIVPVNELNSILQLNYVSQVPVHALQQQPKNDQQAVSLDMVDLYKKIRQLCLKSRFDLEMLLQSKDERNTGFISQYSFKKIMRPFTPHITHQELDLIFESFDHNKTKILNYNDFISKIQEIDIDILQIIIQIQESMKGYNINEQQLFNSFDQNHDGFLTLQEFDSMLQSLAILLPEEEVWECFQCFDFEGAGEISLTQFTKVMRGQKPSNTVSIHNILMKNQSDRKQINPQSNTQQIKIQPKSNKKTVNFQGINQIEAGGIFQEIEPKIPASHLIMTQLQVDNVVRLVNQFVQKRERTMQDLLEFYFPSNDRIDEQTFVSQTLKLECGLHEKAAKDLFYYLDSYVTGLVGVDQFKRIFMPSQQQEQEQKAVRQPKQPPLKPAQVPVPKQKKQMLTGQHQLESLVVAVKAFVVRKKRTVDDLVQFFYPPGGASQLDEKAFVKLAVRLQLDLREQQVLELFYHLDINGSGLVSMNEFCLVFVPESRGSEKVEKKQLNSLDDEIAALFDQVDDNKNGYVEQKELRHALIKVGLNASNEELAQYFSLFDKNNDNSISKEEFITIIREFVRKELGSVNDLIVDLRREFKNADVTNSRSLRPNQIKNVFKNLGIAVPEDDIGTLFKELDYDKSGKIDIDELIHFMTMNQSGMTARAAQVVMNIKGSQRISLKDLKVMFDQMPQNFTSSFCRTNNKRGQNLPSSSFKHKLDQSGLFYTDIIFVKNAETQNNQSVLEKLNIPQIAIEIQFLGAEGIPITDDKDIPRESYAYREIAVVLYDRVKAVYLGNVVYLAAQWQKQYEDRWSFDQSADKSTIIFNQAKFDERRDDHIDLIVEMIAYIKRSNKVIELTCCHAQIPLTNLVRLNGKMTSELRGGAPGKVLVIDKKDVRANHEGWRKVMQALSSNVQSSLTYEVRKINNAETLKGLTTLPEKVIIPLFALNYIQSFREYFAFKSLASVDPNIQLQQNPELKSLLTIIDCHIAYERVMVFWNTSLKPKISSFQIMINALQALGNGLFLLLNAQEFKFNKLNPTKRTFDANENKKKIELLDLVLNDILSTFQSNKSNQKKALYPFNYEPIHMNELMDDDEEAENNQFDRIANRKSRKIK